MFYSLQGEGVTIGIPAVFLRLQHCNLLCQWCDTIAVWRQGHPLSFAEILGHWQQAGWLKRLQEGAHLVCTGGEPTLQKQALAEFLKFLQETLKIKPYTELETNGTLLPDPLTPLITQFNVSPKLSNSGMSKEKRYKPEVLAFYARCPSAYFKFVIASEADWVEIQQDFLEVFDIDKQRVLLMPQATSRDELMRSRQWVAELCKEHGLRYSDRLQLAIWDKATGV